MELVQIILLGLDYGERALIKFNQKEQKISFAIPCTIHTHDAHTRDMIAKANMSSRH